jgi:hypothetical protein
MPSASAAVLSDSPLRCKFAFYWGFSHRPSHSIRDVFIRFNGVTNDSLSTGLLLSPLVPWAVGTHQRLVKTSALTTMSVLTGSLFSAIAVLTATLAYAIYRQLYAVTDSLIIGLIIAGVNS